MRRALPALGLLALAALALALVLALAAPAGAEAGLENPALLEDRGAIRIDGDHHLDAEHGVRGGNGTLEDPYLIAHWRINTTTQHVRIANTTKAWMLRNVELNGQCDPRGVASNCLFEAGVYVENVRGGVVLHTRITGMDRTGLYAERSVGVEFVENHIVGGAAASQGTGILVHDTDFARVAGNRLQGQGPPPAQPLATAAVRIWDSNDTLVLGNDIRGATEVGLNLLAARRAVVEDNTLAGNRMAIVVQGLEALVRYNTIRDNTLAGVLFTNGVLTFERNDLGANPRGLDIGPGALFAGLRANNVAGHGEFGVRLSGNVSVDAKENWWGAPSGPNVNLTGPGTGEAVALNGSRAAQFLFRPFFAERIPDVGAFAPRTGRQVVTGGSSGGGGPGQSVDPAPVAVFEGPAEAFLGVPVEFNAARSFDPEGGALRYAWDLGDGRTAAGLRARHAYNATGEFVVRLTVTDPTGLSGVASVALVVTRQPFEVALRVNATAVRGEEVVLQAIATGHVDGPVAYRFTTGGPGTFTGDFAPTPVARVRLAEPREYLVGVEARAGNETRTAFQRVQVGNEAPVARIGVEPATGTADQDFRFSAAASTDADGDALTYTWDFGGGQTFTGPEVTRRLPPGLNIVLLTVSDGFSSAQAQQAVEVAPGSPSPGPEKPAPGPELLLVAGLLALAARGLGRRR